MSRRKGEREWEVNETEIFSPCPLTTGISVKSGLLMFINIKNTSYNLGLLCNTLATGFLVMPRWGLTQGDYMHLLTIPILCYSLNNLEVTVS